MVMTLAALVTATAAMPPACFPERTPESPLQLWTHSAYGFVGVLRPSRQVRTLSDDVTGNGRWGEIELDRPFPMRFWVRSEQLAVFAQRDVTIVPNFAWWRTGTPLQIVRGTADSALVRGPVDLDWTSIEQPVWTSCSNLRIRREPLITNPDGRCCKNLAAVPDKLRKKKGKVWWLGQPRFRDGSGWHYFEHELVDQWDPGLTIDQLASHSSASVVRTRGSRALVELSLSSGLLVRGWIPERRLNPPLPRGSRGVVGGVMACTMDSYMPIGGQPMATTASAPLTADLGARTPFTVLPVGTKVAMLEQQGEYARIVFRWGRAPAREPRPDFPGRPRDPVPPEAELEIMGWTPLVSLREVKE